MPASIVGDWACSGAVWGKGRAAAVPRLLRTGYIVTPTGHRQRISNESCGMQWK